MSRVFVVLCLVPALAVAAAPPPLPTVEVVRPVVRMVRDTTTYTGRIRPAVSVTVRARVSGPLLRVVAKPGAEVKKGDTLFAFDARRFEAALKLADARLAVADAALKLADIDVRRFQKLLQAKAVSAEEYDRAAAVLAEARAKTMLAKAERDLAALDVAAATVVAPIAGTFAPSAVEPGDVCKADETVLATVSDARSMAVDFALDEDEAVAFHGCDAKEKAVRRKVVVSWDHHKAEAVIEPVAGGIDESTGKLRVRALMPKPAAGVLPGRKVEVTMIVSEPREAIFVPLTAVFGERLSVVSKGNAVERRPCLTHRRSGDLIEVRKGFAEGERIVREWSDRLREGTFISPKEVPAAK